MFPFFLFHYLFLFLFFDVSAQGPPLPSTNLTKDRSYEEKVSTARGAIDIEVTVTTDTNGTLSFYDNFLVQGLPTLYSQMAELDTITRNTTYREILQDQLPQAAAELVSSDLVLNYLVHGYAATKAYIAYRDDHFLTLAQQLWEFGKAYCISDEDIEAKQNAKKTSSLRTECDGKSLVGGVFLTTNLTNGAIEFRATSAFFTLSAVLAEATSNATYIKAANQTLQFLKNFGYFPRSDDPSDQKGILALDSDPPCHSNSYVQWYPTTGDIIEGLSILASLQDDATTESFLQDAINSSTLYRNNQQSNGVIHMTRMPFSLLAGDPFLVRGLGTAYRKNHIEPGMREYIKDFINIQYNYLLDDAIIQQSNVYVDSGSGLRPPARNLSPINQTYAVMVFVQAIGSANDTGAGDPSSSSRPGTTGSGSGGGTTKAFTTGAIVGIVVGIVAFLALLSGFIACLCLRRRRRERKLPFIYQTSPFHLPDPNSEMDESSLTSPTSLTSPGVRGKSWLQAGYSARTDPFSPVSLTTPTTPTTPVSSKRPGVRVKTRLDSPLPSHPPTVPSVATPSEENRAVGPAEDVDSGPLNDDPHARFHAMSTTEMVRVLNARVQAEGFINEGPPSYFQSEVQT